MNNYDKPQPVDRLLIDVSSIIRAAHMGKKDPEGTEVEFEGKTVWVNSAMWAYERTLEVYTEALKISGTKPYQTVICLDGIKSRMWRQQILPSYKGQRKPMAPEVNEAFNEAVEAFIDDVKSLGGTVASQYDVEADDIIAYFCEKLEGHNYVLTRDRDLFALRDEKTTVIYRGETDTPAQWGDDCDGLLWSRVYKSLVGDNSDNIKGCKGFGDKTFVKFVAAFGDDGIELFDELLESGDLSSLEEDVVDFKPLQKVLDNSVEVISSYLVAKFFTHKVNTLQSPLEISTGYCHEYDPDYPPELKRFFATKLLITAGNYDTAYEFVKEHMSYTPFVALDIETSTPEASDAWVEALRHTGRTKKKAPVDVFGSELTGMSLTFGDNLQHTIYISVDHLEVENCTVEQAMKLLELVPAGVRLAVHNSEFEMPVLHNAWGAEWKKTKDKIWGGFLPNVWDTAKMKSYVDENTSLGLKYCSKAFFDYDQVSYAEVTQDQEKYTNDKGEEKIRVLKQYKMNELSADRVFDYGCDDTIMTAGVFNHCLLVMETEETINAFRRVELWCQYAIAQAFIDGVDFNSEALEGMKAEDQETYDKAWAIVREYLISINWVGSTFVPAVEFTAKTVKDSFLAITGEKLDTRARKFEKLAAQAEEQGYPGLAKVIESEDLDTLNGYAKSESVQNPEFSMGSTKNKCELLYEVMKFPVRLRNKPTDKMRKEGKWEGNPKADADVFKHALKLDMEGKEEYRLVLESLKDMMTIMTRFNLFYNPYSYLPHWKDGKMHYSAGQARTVTRRFAPSNPNIAQVPKRGDGKKLRSLYLPPKDWDMIASDFSGQEMRILAELSGDKNLISCFVGNNKRDPHHLTAVEIAKILGIKDISTYEAFDSAYTAGDKTAAELRTSAKPTNFGYVYGISAEKLGVDLIVDKEEAEKFLAAYDEAYPLVKEWKEEVTRSLHTFGYTKTLLGARRHLTKAITTSEVWQQRAAERQGINFEIQGSAAEMTKIAVGKSWVSGLFRSDYAQFLLTVHDEEVVASRKDKTTEVTKEVVDTMTEQYATMRIPLNSDAEVGPNFGELK